MHTTAWCYYIECTRRRVPVCCSAAAPSLSAIFVAVYLSCSSRTPSLLPLKILTCRFYLHTSLADQSAVCRQDGHHLQGPEVLTRDWQLGAAGHRGRQGGRQPGAGRGEG